MSAIETSVRRNADSIQRIYNMLSQLNNKLNDKINTTFAVSSFPKYVNNGSISWTQPATFTFTDSGGSPVTNTATQLSPCRITATDLGDVTKYSIELPAVRNTGNPFRNYQVNLGPQILLNGRTEADVFQETVAPGLFDTTPVALSALASIDLGVARLAKVTSDWEIYVELPIDFQYGCTGTLNILVNDETQVKSFKPVVFSTNASREPVPISTVDPVSDPGATNDVFVRNEQSDIDFDSLTFDPIVTIRPEGEEEVNFENVMIATGETLAYVTGISNQNPGDSDEIKALNDASKLGFGIAIELVKKVVSS